MKKRSHENDETDKKLPKTITDIPAENGSLSPHGVTEPQPIPETTVSLSMLNIPNENIFINRERFPSQNVKMIYTKDAENIYQAVLKEFKKTDPISRCPIYVHGNSGIGKSYSIFAVVDKLKKEGKTVFYIQDCKSWVENPQKIFKQLAIDFRNNKNVFNMIEQMIIEAKSYTTDTRFLKLLEIFEVIDNEFGNDELVFVFDQIDYLLTMKRQGEDSKFLPLIKNNFGILGKAVTVVSSSANVESFAITEITNPKFLEIHAGFDEPTFKFFIENVYPTFIRNSLYTDVIKITNRIPLEVRLLFEELGVDNLDSHISAEAFREGFLRYWEKRKTAITLSHKKFIKEIEDRDDRLVVETFVNLRLKKPYKEFITNMEYVNRQLISFDENKIPKFITPLAESCIVDYHYHRHGDEVTKAIMRLANGVISSYKNLNHGPASFEPQSSCLL